jgi:hypothetical protein
MKKLSQIPGLDTMPTAGGASGGAEAQSAPPSFNIIYSPLDSLGKILADLDFKTFLENHFGDNSGDLAHKIWVMYGGSEDEIGVGKKGEREDSPQSSDMIAQSDAQQKEYNATRKSRWLRLPKGVSIDEITNTEAIEKSIVGGFATLAKSFVKPAGSTVDNFFKIANNADEKGKFSFADKLDFILTNVYSS